MKELIKPRRLSAGDIVAITAPASPGAPDQIKAAAACFEKLGLRVRFGDTISKRHGYLSGTDADRAGELNAMFADPEINAIVCARGGYGTGRIADMLDYDLIRANPKIFWGYSDITFLHAAIGRYAGLATFHGPMMIDLEHDSHPLTLQNYELLVRPAALRYTEQISPLHTLVAGAASGPLVGGNLSLLVSALGTPYELETKGKILFIEDIDEEPYRIDRMLNQMRLAGKFADAAGILICDFNNCEPDKRKTSLILEQIFDDHIVSAAKPTLSGFKIGHCSPHIAVPIGIEARMSTYDKLLACMEPGIDA